MLYESRDPPPWREEAAGQREEREFFEELGGVGVADFLGWGIAPKGYSFSTNVQLSGIPEFAIMLSPNDLGQRR
jgi:hypothetical protein